MNDACTKAAEQIKYQIRHVTEPVFDVISKDPEVPHVADQMQPAAMQEHRRQKRQSNRQEWCVGSGPGENERRSHAILLDERLQSWAERKFVEEDEHIDQD